MRVLIISIKLNVLQLKLGCFISMKIICKVLTSALGRQNPINNTAWNNCTLILVSRKFSHYFCFLKSRIFGMYFHILEGSKVIYF